MPKKVFRAIYAVNYCIQAGFFMVCPAGLIILGGWLLRTRCGLGRWIMIAAIVFGVFAGLYSMFHFLLTAARTMDPTAPPSSDVPSSHKKEDDPHGTR